MKISHQTLFTLMLAAWLGSGCSDPSENAALKHDPEPAQVDQDRFSRALLVAHTIEDPSRRAITMAKIAGMMAESGQQERALELLAEVHSTAKTKPWPDFRLLCDIAGRFAAVGQQEQASRILAEALRKARTAKRMYDGVERNALNSIPDIAIQYAEIGEFDQAIETLASIKDDTKHRFDAWAGIASAYAKAGQDEQARRLLSHAIETAEKFEGKWSPYEKSKPWTRIAGVYLEIGDHQQATLRLAQALKSAETMPMSGNRLKAFAEIATTYAKAGAFDRALEVFNTIEGLNADDRCAVLVEIARGHQKAGQHELANSILLEALKIVESVERGYAKSRPLVSIAGVHADLGQNEQAMLLLAQAIDAYGRYGWSRSKCQLFAEIAGTYRKMQQNELADQLFTEATQAAARIHESDKSRAWFHIAAVHVDAGEEEKAQPLLSQALHAATTFEDSEIQHEILRELALGHAKAGDFDQALKMARVIQSRPSNRSEALCNIAGIYEEMRQQEQAMQILSEALDSANAERDPEGKSRALTEIAVMLARHGEKEKATQLLSDARQTVTSLPDGYLDKFHTLVDIAGKFAEVGDFDRAVEAAMQINDVDHKSRALADIAGHLAKAGDFDQALQMTAMIEDPRSKTRAWINISGTYLEIQEMTKATQSLTQAHETAKTITDAYWQSFAFTRIAEIHLRLEQKDQAFSKLAEAYKASMAIENVWNKSSALCKLASLHQLAGQKQQAADLLSQAIDFAKTIEEELIRSFALDEISVAVAEAGDFVQALEIAKIIEDADCKSWALQEIALRIAQLDENDAAIIAGMPVDAQAEITREERIEWWREARFGMFIHWGLYAIPAGTWKDKVHETGYSEWIMYEEKIPVAEYSQLAAQFNPVKFDANEWAAIARKAGMRYVVMTAKHHDGFSMFDSKHTDYDIVDATPFKRDVTRELADAFRSAGLRFGCYYSVDRDWHRPQGPGNRYNQTNTWDYPASTREDFDRYFEAFAQPQVEELITRYPVDLLWFDGIEMKNDAQVDSLYQMIRSKRPDCIINSRIRGVRPPIPIPPPNADYISSGDNEITDRYLGFEWENPASMNTSFGYNANDHNWVEPGEIIRRLVDIVSKGGNYLLNVGPTADGRIPQASIDHLMEVGKWMDVHGEAIYGTMPWRIFRDGTGQADVHYTTKKNSLYAIAMKIQDQELRLLDLGKEKLKDHTISSIRILGSDEALEWRQNDEALVLQLPKNPPSPHAVVFRINFEK